MAIKPNPNSILSTYALDDLLDLVRQKAESIAEEKLEETKKQINDVISLAVGAPVKAAAKRPGRPPSTKQTATSPKSQNRGEKQKRRSLSSFLLEAIGSSPMGVDDILAAITKLGYQSKSEDPRRILYLELKKQVDKKNLKKVGRGTYVAK